MSRKIGLVAVAVVAIGLAVAVFLARRTSVEEISQLIQEYVPQGSTYDRVGAFLDSLGVERSNYDSEEMQLLAVWRRSYVSLFEEGAIQAYFFFDEQGVLVRFELKEVVIAM